MNTATYTINVSHLDWDYIPHGHIHDEEKAEIYHECVNWCLENNIQVDFEYVIDQVKWDEGGWDPVDMRPTYYAQFATTDDLIMFVLRWSEIEYVVN